MKIKDYFTPKSMVYTGSHQDVKTTIFNYHFDDTTLSVSDNFQPLPGYRHYIQVIGLSDVEKIKKLHEYYPIDPLVLEDVFNVKQRNKIEIKENSIFSVFHVNYLEKGKIVSDYLSILLFSDVVISFHEEEPKYLDVLVQLLDSHPETKQKSSDYLFYNILDIITDHHLEVYEHLEKKTMAFEEEILESKSVNQEQFYLLRKELLKLKNTVSPILDQFSELLSSKNALLKAMHFEYFNDLKDHLVRLNHHLDQSRELMRNLLDLHINNQSNKMNRIMTTLTLFSAIFIPLSFLTGFFGMNFVHFGILAYEHALAIFSGLCVLLAIGMIWFFKKMKWF